MIKSVFKMFKKVKVAGFSNVHTTVAFKSGVLSLNIF